MSKVDIIQLQSLMQDPFQNIFQEGIEEFVIYQNKRPDDHQTHSQRMKEKIKKLEKDLADPQVRRKRNHERRQHQKDKMNLMFQTMSKQQIRAYLDARRNKRKQEKKKLKQGFLEGQTIFIDLVFEDKMNGKQNKSLAMQIQLIFKDLRRAQQPPSIHLCSFQGGIKSQLQKMGYQYWPMTSNAESVVQIAKKMSKKLIYLSPDAPLPLQTVDQQTAYVMGGLIDRSIIKFASLYRAQSLGIEARHLPIKQFMKSRSCLNLDHVVKILCKFKETNDWKEAFTFGAPKRWKKQSGSQKSLSQQEQEQDQSQEEKTKSQQLQASYNQFSNNETVLEDSGKTIGDIPTVLIQETLNSQDKIPS